MWRERVYAEELEPAYARGAYAGSHLVQGGALDLMSAFSSSAASRSFDWLVLRPLFSRTSDRDVLRDYDLNRLQEVNIAVSNGLFDTGVRGVAGGQVTRLPRGAPTGGLPSRGVRI